MENRLRTRDKQKHCRKYDISREPVGFAHNAPQSLLVVLHAAEHGKKRRSKNLRHRRDAHFAPFVGLRVAAELRQIVVSADNKRIDIKRHRVEKRTEHDTAADTQHRAKRRNAETMAWQPAGSQPQKSRFDGGKRQRLPDYRPCAVAGNRQPNAHNARHDESDGVGDGYLRNGHLLHQTIGLDNGSRIEYERQKHCPRQTDKPAVAENLRYQRRTKPQNGIDCHTHAQVEIEHRAIIRLRRRFLLYQRSGKSTIDKEGGKSLKHKHGADQSEVGFRQEIGKHHSGDCIKHLRGEFVCRIPLQRSGCLKFQVGLFVHQSASA